eukprot:749586-Hanusia_phi.AAC.4
MVEFFLSTTNQLTVRRGWGVAGLYQKCGVRGVIVTAATTLYYYVAPALIGSDDFLRVGVKDIEVSVNDPYNARIFFLCCNRKK